MDRGAWQTKVHRVAKSSTQLSSVYIYDLAIYISISPLFLFPSHFGHHRALSRIPSAIHWFSLVIYFIHSINGVYILILKNLQAINAREAVEKRGPSCTVGGNIN